MTQQTTFTSDQEREIQAHVEHQSSLVKRHKTFVRWRDKSLALKAAGLGAIPPPFDLDDYELRRAMEDHII